MTGRERGRSIAVHQGYLGTASFVLTEEKVSMVILHHTQRGGGGILLSTKGSTGRASFLPTEGRVSTMVV